MVGSNTKSWDQQLFPAEFAFNRSVNRSTRFSHFYIVYGYNPRSALKLAPIPDLNKFPARAAKVYTQLQDIHAAVHKKLLESNAKYKAAVDQSRRLVEC